MAQAKLKREVFATSRLLEFCSERELINQTGHAVGEWPLVVLKELVDNAIDAAEEACAAPVISVAVKDGKIVVTDNGPGIRSKVVRNILDYNVRVSSREAYVSPTRGAQGNALKTVIAMPLALNSADAETVIESQGVSHRIRFEVDPVRQEPRIEHHQTSTNVKTGTRITTPLPVSSLHQTRTRRNRDFYKSPAGSLGLIPTWLWMFAGDGNASAWLRPTWGGRSGGRPIQPQRTGTTGNAWRA